MKWTESTGGPLLLLQPSLLQEWEGINPARSGRVQTDYDRACAVVEYVGAISVGEGHGLVLGDMPMPAAWWPESGGILVRWMAAESEQAVIEALKALPADLSWQTEVSFDSSGEDLVLFDSAWPGKDLPAEVATLHRPRGRHAVETAVLQEEEISLVLHRFKVL